MKQSLTPVLRMLTVAPVVLALSFSLLVGYTLSPATPQASAGVVSAAKAANAVKWAQTRKGLPYRYGAVGPRSFDCSGLTRWAFAKVGRSLPHSSKAQVGFTKRIARSDRRKGDLVFFGGRGGVYHVGIYAGRNTIWHASRPGTPVRKSKIWTSRVFYGRVR